MKRFKLINWVFVYAHKSCWTSTTTPTMASLAGEGKSACSTAASSALPTPPPADESPLVGVARRAKEASRVLMATSHESRNAVLAGVQELLRERREDILAANQKDLDAATESG